MTYTNAFFAVLVLHLAIVAPRCTSLEVKGADVVVTARIRDKV